jgi:hypothetical protein
MLRNFHITFFVGISLLAVTGCTIIGHEKIPDWPSLEVREHYVAHHIMRDKCSRYVAFGMSPEACAEFNLNAGTCDIWYSADFPPGPGVVEHERMHCEGYDHIGGQVLRKLHAAWRQQQLSTSLPSMTVTKEVLRAREEMN